MITDVNMPDLDGFQLLEHVRIEMDLPIISEFIVYLFLSSLSYTLVFVFLKTIALCNCTVMSIDGGVDRVMKGIQHGACDYLLKPIRMEELQNIWQHVIRKKIRKGENIQVMISDQMMMVTNKMQVRRLQLGNENIWKSQNRSMNQ